MTCMHLQTCFKALGVESKMPGVFECVACGGSFAQDPNNPKGVRYLSQPKVEKVLPETIDPPYVKER